jgi:sugar lactone lactonase YvrE
LIVCGLQVQTFYEAGTEVGKAGIWDPETGNYYYVDILKMILHVLHVPTLKRTDYNVGTMVGAMALSKNGKGLVMAVEDGFGFWDLKEHKFRLLASPYGVNTGWRMNDGACDSKGRFWAGRLFKTDETKPGEVYRLETDGVTAKLMIEDICCTNGVLWSPDNKRLYISDSTVKKIFLWDFDEESGTPTNRRVFLDTGEKFEGKPDGANIDSEGYLWVCFFDGNKLVRFTPEAKVDQIIVLPVKRPTQPVWYGESLDELLVTTAYLDVDKNEFPQSGDILWLQTDAKGHLRAKYQFDA